MRVGAIERRLLTPAVPATFDEQEYRDLPEPVRRYLVAAIAAGTPLATSARIEMVGRIRLRGWLPFRARQTLAPHRGFVWSARVAGVVTGYDRYVGGAGEMHWRVLGLLPVMRAAGVDVSRSAAGRGAVEAFWLPPSLLPRFGVEWTATDDRSITASYQLDDVPIAAHYTIDHEGRLVSLVFDRWGDPDDTGMFGWHPFGGEFTRHTRFHGLTIPSAGRVGWFAGTDRWDEGEFFRYEITDLVPTTS